ncbi:MAG: DUF4143 domain-containing protein [Candidatus Omnitrophica bacterium]|nr:DUF4143 domain-containing protein [Candidatus Omnitrophota bacterium]
MIKGDIRDLSRIQELGQIELLAEILKHQTEQLTNYSKLSNKINVSSDTIRRWIKTLQGFFTVLLFSHGLRISLVLLSKNQKLIYGIGLTLMKKAAAQKI